MRFELRPNKRDTEFTASITCRRVVDGTEYAISVTHKHQPSNMTAADWAEAQKPRVEAACAALTGGEAE